MRKWSIRFTSSGTRSDIARRVTGVWPTSRWRADECACERQEVPLIEHHEFLLRRPSPLSVSGRESGIPIMNRLLEGLAINTGPDYLSLSAKRFRDGGYSGLPGSPGQQETRRTRDVTVPRVISPLAGPECRADA